MPHSIVLTEAQRATLHMLTPRSGDVLLAQLHQHTGTIVSLNDVAFGLDSDGQVTGLLLEEEQFIFSERRARGLADEEAPSASVTHIHSLVGGDDTEAA